MENASFVIDSNFQDFKADNLGCWSSTGTKNHSSSSRALRVSDKLPSTNQTEYYPLTRWYYIHTAYERYHRHTVDI